MSKDTIAAIGLKIPITLLFGSQPLGHFSEKSCERVDKELKKNGIDYLNRNPITVCALQDGKNLMLVIDDGHHRSRLAPKYKIYTIPAWVLTTEQLAQMKDLDPDEYKRSLEIRAYDTQIQFARVMSLRGKRDRQGNTLFDQTLESLMFEIEKNGEYLGITKHTN